jgi:hypothetical protein
MSKVTKSSVPENDTKVAGPIKRTAKSQDVALICGKTDDGKGLHILRRRGTTLEAGVVQPLEEGKTIHGELVTLRQRGQTPVCDVEVHYKSTPQTAAETNHGANDRGHPAQVASDDYRKNWDTIWRSKSPSKPTLLN